jgi:hypothetical protein
LGKFPPHFYPYGVDVTCLIITSILGTFNAEVTEKLLHGLYYWMPPLGSIFKLTQNGEVQIYDRSRPLAFWMNRCGDLGYELGNLLRGIANYSGVAPAVHHEFIEYWNIQKSVWRIWQHFSCLLDEEIPKIWKKLKSHSGFFRAD